MKKRKWMMAVLLLVLIIPAICYWLHMMYGWSEFNGLEYGTSRTDAFNFKLSQALVKSGEPFRLEYESGELKLYMKSATMADRKKMDNILSSAGAFKE